MVGGHNLSHHLEKAGGVQGPMVGGGGSHRLGKVGTSGEIRMSLEQGGPSHGSLCSSLTLFARSAR